MTADSGSGDDAPTVLVVDDERGLADLYTLWLEDDYNVRVAYDGESALDALDEDVDVVLLDRQMPDLTGDEVLHTLREQNLECRVAMVTAVDPAFDIVEMGFDDYLQKPVDESELRNVVDGLLKRAEYDDVLESYYTAVRKRALLAERKDSLELTESDEYTDLEAEITDLEARVDEVTSSFEDDDFAALFQELDQDG